MALTVASTASAIIVSSSELSEDGDPHPAKRLRDRINNSEHNMIEDELWGLYLFMNQLLEKRA
jgi:hypothetical protein